MDNDEFLRRLSELAEIKQVTIPKSGNTREATEPEVMFRNGHEFSIELDNNPTLSVVVKKLKQQAKACPDCGDMVVNRVVNKKLLTSPICYWREHCTNCNCTRNPYTGEFDLKGIKVTNVYASWIKETHPKFKHISEDTDK